MIRDKKMKISGRKSYVDVESDDIIMRFGGELLCAGFEAYYESGEWIKTKDDMPETAKIDLVVEALLYYDDLNAAKPPKKRFDLWFAFLEVGPLIETLRSIPDFKGEIRILSDLEFEWLLPNGILLDVNLNKIPNKNSFFREWQIDSSYIHDGQKLTSNHWHPSTLEIFTDLVLINSGRLFWAFRKNIFGKAEPSPGVYSKHEFDRMSDRRKSRFTLL